MVLWAEIGCTLFLENEILKSLLSQLNFVRVHLEVRCIWQFLFIQILLVLRSRLRSSKLVIQKVSRNGPLFQV